MPVLISGMLKAPASRPVAGTFYDLVTAYVSFVRLNVHNVTSNHIASNIFRAINFKNQRVSTRNSTAPTHAPPDFGCAADNGGARAVRERRLYPVERACLALLNLLVHDFSLVDPLEPPR